MEEAYGMDTSLGYGFFFLVSFVDYSLLTVCAFLSGFAVWRTKIKRNVDE